MDRVRTHIKDIFAKYLETVFNSLQLTEKERLLLYMLNCDHSYRLVSWYSPNAARMKIHPDRTLQVNELSFLLRAASQYKRGHSVDKICPGIPLPTNEQWQQNMVPEVKKLRERGLACDVYPNEYDQRAKSLLSIRIRVKNSENVPITVGMLAVESYNAEVPRTKAIKDGLENNVDEPIALLLRDMASVIPSVRWEDFLSAHPELLEAVIQ